MDSAASIEATVGVANVMVVRLRDEEDATRLQFNQSTYRPSSSYSDVVILVKRTGDLSLASRARVATRDGSAKEALDFVLVNRDVHFGVGQTDAWVRLTFPTKPIWMKSLSVVLSVDEASNARLGVIGVATVFIPPSVASGPVILPAEPVVVSLLHYGSLNLI